MRTAPRRVAALTLAVVGLAMLPATSANAAPIPPVNPTRNAENVRDDYQGHVHVVRGKATDPRILRGSVFVDDNKNSVKDKNERGIAGVQVSNGRDVVVTDVNGDYAIGAFDRMTVFVTQPAGYAVPVNEDNIAQFSYNHFPAGSPTLKFGGIAPTGALPKAVNFPMVISRATRKADQNCATAGDTQAYNLTQLTWARQGAIRDLIERTDLGGCGVMLLGDNVGDDLSLNEPTKDAYRQVKGPVRAIPGNHDQDYDAAGDSAALDTFRRDFGPAYFSYEVGEAHIVGLDSTYYKGAKPDGKNGGYYELIDSTQVAWLKKDLARVPANKLVVIHSHAPFVGYRGVIVDNSTEVFAALKSVGRTAENTVLVGGHTHTLENILPGAKSPELAAGGVAELPFHQLVDGAVSGDWYSGSLDQQGLPNAYGIDGVRPGTLTLALSGNRYVESYKVRQEPWTHRISAGVNSPEWRAWAAAALAWRSSKDPAKGPIPTTRDLNVVTMADLRSGKTYLNANFYLGSREATVEVSVDGRQFALAKHTRPMTGEANPSGFEFSDVPAATANLKSTGNVSQSSSSVWRVALPTNLTTGTHTATVRATDRFDRVYTQTVRFAVVD